MARRKKKLKIDKKKLDRTCWRVVGAAFVFSIFAIFHANGVFYEEIYSANKSVIEYPVPKANLKKAWVEFDFNNGHKRTFVGNFDKEYALVAVLESAAQDGQFKLSIKKHRLSDVL